MSDAQILEVMRRHVLAFGPQVSLDRVAADLSVTPPALLKRFGNREALMVSALRPSPEPEWLRGLADGPTDAPLADQLGVLFARMSAFMAEVVPCMMALKESGIPFSRIWPDPREPQRGLRALASWLERARAAGLVTARELETIAFAIIGSLQTRVFFSHVLGTRPSVRQEKRYVEELVAIFSRVLAPPSRTTRSRSSSHANRKTVAPVPAASAPADLRRRRRRLRPAGRGTA